MDKIKQAIEAHMREAAIRLLNQGFDGYRSEYLGYVRIPERDGQPIAGHVWHMSDPITGEGELIVLQDNGELLGFLD